MLLVILILLVAGLCALMVVTYNSLIGKLNKALGMYDSADAIQRSRYEMIPEILSLVSKYATDHQDMFESLQKWTEREYVRLRDKDKSESEDSIIAAIQTIKDGAEFESLRNSDEYMRFIQRYSENETELLSARFSYNKSAVEYNTVFEAMPAKVVGGMMGFEVAQKYNLTVAQ